MNSFDFFQIISSGYFVTFIVIYIVLTAGLGAWVADKKGYSPVLWFLMCLLTGIAGVIAISGVPSQIKETDSNDTSSEFWTCKKCQTENLGNTPACRGCGSACE